MRFCIIRALGLALLPLAVISQNFHGSSPPKPGYGTLSPFGAFSSKPLIVPENATSEEKAEYDKLISGKGEGLGPFSAGGIFQAAILESRTEKPPVLNKQAKRIITRFGAYGLVPAVSLDIVSWSPSDNPRELQKMQYMILRLIQAHKLSFYKFR
jgi:hypothetical protein